MIKAHLKVFADKGIISKYAHPGKDPVHRQIAEDERRQDQQEGTAQAIRRHVAVRPHAVE